jgi:hypothetical protein
MLFADNVSIVWQTYIYKNVLLEYVVQLVFHFLTLKFLLARLIIYILSLKKSSNNVQCSSFTDTQPANNEIKSHQCFNTF